MSRKATLDQDREVGRRVKVRRLEIGLSLEKLGDALGITFQQVQKYEKGINRIGAGRLQQIATILKVPASYFFDDGGHAPGGGGRDLFALLDTAYSLRLLRAFARIKDQRLQRSTVELVEEVAQSSNPTRQPN